MSKRKKIQNPTTHDFMNQQKERVGDEPYMDKNQNKQIHEPKQSSRPCGGKTQNQQSMNPKKEVHGYKSKPTICEPQNSCSE
jgi:hypothetical protein